METLCSLGGYWLQVTEIQSQSFTNQEVSFFNMSGSLEAAARDEQGISGAPGAQTFPSSCPAILSTQPSFAGSSRPLSWLQGRWGGRIKDRNHKPVEPVIFVRKTNSQFSGSPTYWPHGPSLLHKNMGNRVCFSWHIATLNSEGSVRKIGRLDGCGAGSWPCRPY